MANGLILYKSKYGSSKKYAEWLVEATGFDLIESDKASLASLQACDRIVLIGGIYATGIAGVKVLKKNMDELYDKKIAVLCVGASPLVEGIENIFKEKDFNNNDNVKVFYARGSWDKERMTFRDKILCSMLHSVISKKDPEEYEPWESALMQSYGQKADWTDKDYLIPLIKYINE